MDRVHTIGIYKVLRVLSSTSRHHIFKVKLNNQIFRLTAVSLMLSAQLTQSQSERVYQLLQKCSKYKELNHHNLETITDIFHHQEGPDHFLAIVGQYATEGDLEDFIQDDNTSKLAEMKTIMINLCSAVQYLHNHSIIHCSINPENIRKVDGKYKITFPQFKEIAWFNRRNKRTSTGQNESFNKYYISPEQHSRATFSQSTDIWSMGIIFYELLSGRQFRLLSPQPKFPCQMGDFTDQMLADVPNYMMRSLLKEMLPAEDGNRIGIDRVKNILTNTDISVADQFLDEEIVDNTKQHELALSIFSGSTTIEGYHESSLNAESEMDSIEYSLEKFKIVLVCKHENNCLQICAYNQNTGLSIMTEHTYHKLPPVFSELFKNVSEIFKELSDQKMRITNITSFGQIIFLLDDERYKQLKEGKVALKGSSKTYNESSTNDSLKLKTNPSEEALWYSDMKDENEEDPNIYFKQEQDDLQKTEQSVNELEKILQGRTKSISQDTTSMFKTYTIGSKLSKIYFGQQNYGRCMQKAQKMVNYFSTFINRPYVTEFISKLIACNEILNEEEQVLKWKSLLIQELPDTVLPCYIYTLVSLEDVNSLYLKYRRLQEYYIVEEKLKFYYEEATERLERLTIQQMDDIIGDRLLIGVQRIFARPSPKMYKILFLLLTRLHGYGKDTAAYGTPSFSQEITKVLMIYSSMAARLLPKLYKLMQQWVKENMPENQAKIFSKKALGQLLSKYYN